MDCDIKLLLSHDINFFAILLHKLRFAASLVCAKVTLTVHSICLLKR